MKRTVDVSQIIIVLNNALRLDQLAINRLFSNYTPCNGALANSKSVVIGCDADFISPLGMLNGILDNLQLDRIAVVLDESGLITKFINIEELPNH